MQVTLRLDCDYQVPSLEFSLNVSASNFEFLVLDCVQVISSPECDYQVSKGKQFWIQNMITKSGMWLPSPDVGLRVSASNFESRMWLLSPEFGYGVSASNFESGMWLPSKWVQAIVNLEYVYQVQNVITKPRIWSPSEHW